MASDMSKFLISMFDGKMDFTAWKMTIEDVLLANVDDAIKDEEQALLMLSSLPKSYKLFVQIMLTGMATLTFEDVLKALHDNERIMRNGNSSSSDKLLVADNSGRGRNFHRGSSKGRLKSRMGGDQDMSVVECYYCGEMGHETSSHICNDRAMFETLNDKGQFGEIKVGSKHMMKIEGVGSIRFKLHDGSVKAALNVKYVSRAARNILSLGVLTSRGYRYVGRKEIFKVYKRDQLVIQGRKKPNNLCYLEGRALQGRTCCGGNKGKMKIEKRVPFSDKDEVLGILSQGRIYWGMTQITLIMFWKVLENKEYIF
nr:hypothetical protein [Tanacetum cinerariifolium]